MADDDDDDDALGVSIMAIVLEDGLVVAVVVVAVVVVVVAVRSGLGRRWCGEAFPPILTLILRRRFSSLLRSSFSLLDNRLPSRMHPSTPPTPTTLFW